MKTFFRNTARIFFLIAAFVLFSGELFAAPKVTEKRQKLISCALSYQGSPYVYGGTDPATGIDCSAYVALVARKAVSIDLPRRAHDIYNAVEKITIKEREPGDLVFFKNDMNSSKVTHVGIYCGVYHGPLKKFEGKRVFISAVSDGPRTGVQLELMEAKFWKNHYFATGRILPSTR
ncbi:MAG: C40 family peptidase [Treponema sp.]|nr:C40 family peptidase [Treponema sp.]